MGPTWLLPAPNGSHVGPTTLAVRVVTKIIPYPLWKQKMRTHDSTRTWVTCSYLWLLAVKMWHFIQPPWIINKVSVSLLPINPPNLKKITWTIILAGSHEILMLQILHDVISFKVVGHYNDHFISPLRYIFWIHFFIKVEGIKFLTKIYFTTQSYIYSCRQDKFIAIMSALHLLEHEHRLDSLMQTKILWIRIKGTDFAIKYESGDHRKEVKHKGLL